MAWKAGSKEILNFNRNMETLSPARIPQTFRISFTNLGGIGSKDFIGERKRVRGDLSLILALCPSSFRNSQSISNLSCGT